MIQAAKDNDKLQKTHQKVSKLNLNDITGAHSKWTAGTYEKNWKHFLFLLFNNQTWTIINVSTNTLICSVWKPKHPYHHILTNSFKTKTEQALKYVKKPFVKSADFTVQLQRQKNQHTDKYCWLKFKLLSFYSCCFWSMRISFSCKCQKVSKGLFSVVKKLLLFWSFWSHHMTLMIEKY